MGLRVRLVLVLLSLLAIAALAVPLGLSLADRRTATLAAERGRQLAALADSAAMPGVPLQRQVDRYYEVYGEGVLIVDGDGQPRAARGLSNSEPAVATAISGALVDAPASRWARILPWSRGHVLATGGVRHDGELVGAVVVAVDTSVAARGVATGWLWVAVGCLSLLVLALLVARALTRWVLRPVDGLERAVAEMTEGVAGLPADVAGPPELRHFTSAFNTMSQVVRASLERQRRLVADASHQLRNPLAAVRLRADTLEDHVAEAGRATYGSMTAELDRLENLLQQLLRLARAEEVSGSRRVGLSANGADWTDVDDVVEQRIAFWQPVADGRHQQLRYRSDHPGLCSAARSSRRGAAPRRRTGQRAAVLRAGRHGHRVNRRRGRHGRIVRQRRRPRASGRGPLQGGGTLLAGTGRQGRHRPRTGHRRRDRCGPWRHDRGGAGARRRSAGAVFAAVGKWRATC